MRERVVLGTALALILAVLLAVLASTGRRLAATNSRVAASGVAITVAPGEERCENGLFVPREASMVRLYTGTFGRLYGEPIALSIARGHETVVRKDVPGGQPPGVLEVQLPAIGRDIDPATFCLRNAGSQPIAFAGNLTPLNPGAQQGPNQPGERSTDAIRIDLLRSGSESWLTIAPEIARRFALFKPSFVRPWTLWACLILVLLLWIAAVALLFRPPHASRAFPAAALACAGIAFANAAVWATITPAFQVPDEVSHAGYVQYMAESARVPPVLPTTRTPQLSEEHEALWRRLPFSVEGKPSWTSRHDRELRAELARDLSRRSASGAWTAASNPPLYYAVVALPTRVAARLNALDRLYAMRLVSALFCAITVLFVFFFMRELLPGAPLTWIVGALAAAFQPLFGFLSGGITNDNLLFTAGAAALFVLARIFRRGLTLRLGLGIGLATATGILVKPSMVGMVPGVALGLALAWKTSATTERRAALQGAGAAATVFGMVTAAWFVASVVILGRPALPAAAPFRLAGPRSHPTFGGALSYFWDFFIPPLPFVPDRFPGYPHYPFWDVYVQGFIGRFGYFQYGFSPVANILGLVVLSALVIAAIVACARRRPQVRRRIGEALCYGVVASGVVVMTGLVGYRYLLAQGANFEQTRYLLLLLPFYGSLVAISTRCADPKWDRSLSILVILTAMAHSLGAMLLTLARYYA